MATQWVWGYLVSKLFSGEKEYLTVEDLEQAFPDELKDVMFAHDGCGAVFPLGALFGEEDHHPGGIHQEFHV